MPLGSSIWIEGANGENLSTIEAAGPDGAWTPKGHTTQKPSEQPPRIVLKRGERYEIGIRMLTIMRELSRERRAGALGTENSEH